MHSDILRLIDAQIARSNLLRRAGREPGKTGQVVVISRQLGSGGRLVGERLAERLGWGFWDQQLVDAIANDAAVSRKVVETFDEKTVSEIEMLARSVVGDKDTGSFLYRKHLAHALISIARHGNAVIVGRGANFLLPDALSVRVIAGEERRISNLMEYEGLTREEALRRIRESDHERASFIRNTFNRNIEDPLAYDLVTVTDCFDIEGTVELIITALKVRATSCWRAGR